MSVTNNFTFYVDALDNVIPESVSRVGVLNTNNRFNTRVYLPSVEKVFGFQLASGTELWTPSISVFDYSGNCDLYPIECFAPNGYTVNGEDSYILNTRNEQVVFVYNGTSDIQVVSSSPSALSITYTKAEAVTGVPADFTRFKKWGSVEVQANILIGDNFSQVGNNQFFNFNCADGVGATDVISLVVSKCQNLQIWNTNHTPALKRADFSNNPKLLRLRHESAASLTDVTIDGCKFLYVVSFFGCALNQASVDGILVYLASLLPSHVPQSVNVGGGTNSAPSATGLAAIAALTGAGCVVTNN